MHKSISRVIACVMLLAGIVFVLFALHHPQLSWPWGNTVSYFLYLVYLIAMVVLFIAPYGKKGR